MTLFQIPKLSELFTEPDLTRTRIHIALHNRVCITHWSKVLSPWATSPLHAAQSPGKAEYLTLLGDAMRQLQPEAMLFTAASIVFQDMMSLSNPQNRLMARFAVKRTVVSANWAEAEQLFVAFASSTMIIAATGHGASRQWRRTDHFLRTLLSQPLLWMRLKTIVSQQRFDWSGL